MSTPAVKPDRIETEMKGIQLCPKCKRMTCFVLPDFEWKDGYIVNENPIGWSCPKCKVESHSQCQ